MILQPVRSTNGCCTSFSSLPSLPPLATSAAPGSSTRSADRSSSDLPRSGATRGIGVSTSVSRAAPQCAPRTLGVVTFTGVVVGNRTVTFDHGGVRTSYSFLTQILTSRGATVGRGQVIAVSGHHGGRPSLHFSVRIRDVYVDPEPLLVCRGDPGPGLWLR